MDQVAPAFRGTDTKGHEGLLTDHDIAADGTVTPSVVCTEEDCGFHDWVKLVGWERG